MATAGMRYSLVVDLAGNLQATARRYGESLSRFAQGGEQQLSRLARAAGAVDRGIMALGNRYTALATGATASAAIKFVGDLDFQMRQLAVNAEQSVEELDGLKQKVFEVAQAPDIRIDPAQLLAAVNEIVVKTGDLAFAQENIENIGLAVRAMSAEGADVGASMANLSQKMRIRNADEILAVFDGWSQQAKLGAIGMAELAPLADRVFASYSRLTRVGPEAALELGAALQMIKQGVGSPEEAATALDALIRNLQDPEKVKGLQAAGIRIIDPEDPNRMRSLVAIMKDLISVTGGDAMKLGNAFDSEAVKALIPLAAAFKADGDFRAIDQFMSVQNTGGEILRQDARTLADSFNAATQNLWTSAQRFADAKLTGAVQALADAMNALTPAMQNAVWSGLAAVGVGAVGYVGARRVGGMLGLGRGTGAGAAVAGAATAVAGPQPVLVTNWPVGMAAGGAPAGRGGGRSGTLGRFASAAPVAAGAVSVPAAAARGAPWASRLNAAGRVAPVAGLALYGVDAAASAMQGDAAGAVESSAAGLGAWGGALAGAKVGALAGSFAGPLGTAVGTGVGAIGGGIVGSELGQWAARELVDAWNEWFAGQEPPKQEIGGEITVRFEGAPTGTRVTGVSSATPGVDFNVDAGLMLGAP
jgi:phage tail tape-measure protein